jgi:hypothetical protein
LVYSTGFHHFVGTEAVQMREGDFSNQLVKGFICFESTSFDVPEVIEDVFASRLLLFCQMRHLCVWIGSDLVLLCEDAELAFQGIASFVFKQPATLRNDVSEFIANLLVHVRIF